MPTITALVVAGTLGASAAPPNPPPSPEPEQPPSDGPVELVVGTRVAPPFSLKRGERWAGITHALLARVAEQEGFSFVYRELELDALISAASTGEVDVAAAAITMTEAREEQVDFSHPFHDSGLGLAVRRAEGSLAWTLLDRLISLRFLQAVGALVVLLGAVGVLIWLVERRRNPEHFPPSVAAGLGAGMWWSAVTMTTVGYGDKAPVTPLGRLVAGIWMFASIIVISGFTAAIASALTVGELTSRIRGLDDLPGRRISTVADSSSAVFLREQGLVFEPVEDVKEALSRLNRGEADAVVYDAPILRYRIQEQGLRVRILPRPLLHQAYGLAFPPGSPLRERFNRRILGITESEGWREVLREHLGREP